MSSYVLVISREESRSHSVLSCIRSGRVHLVCHNGHNACCNELNHEWASLGNSFSYWLSAKIEFAGHLCDCFRFWLCTFTLILLLFFFFYAGHHRCYLLSTGTIKTRAFHSFITFSRLYNEIPHQPQIEINLDVANVRLYYKVFKSQILEVSSKFDFTVFARWLFLLCENLKNLRRLPNTITF